MELNSAISRHLIYRAIYILTQLAAPGVRRGINPPAIIGGVTKGIVTKYLADANGGSRRILRPDCRSGISRICWKIDCRGELSRMRAIDHRRVAIDRIWVLDILKKYQAIQHQRRRPNAIFGNGLRKLGVERKIIPLRDDRGI